MANEIVNNPFGKVAIKGGEEAMKSALQRSSQTGALGIAPEGSQYLNFSGKLGKYSFGSKQEDLTSDELWVVNSMSFEDGWHCWKGNQKLANRMASIYSDVQIADPDFQEFGPFNPKTDGGWQRAKAMVVKSVDEDDRQGYFATCSKSGVGAIAGLQQEIVERLNSGAPAWPLIEFDKEQFTAQGQKNWKPVLRVYGWLSWDQLLVLSNDPDAEIDVLIEASAKEPVPTMKPAKNPDPEPAKVEEAEAEEVEDAPAPKRRRPRL